MQFKTSFICTAALFVIGIRAAPTPGDNGLTNYMELSQFDTPEWCVSLLLSTSSLIFGEISVSQLQTSQNQKDEKDALSTPFHSADNARTLMMPPYLSVTNWET